VSLRHNLVPHHFRAIRLVPHGDTVKIVLRENIMAKSPLIVGVDPAGPGGDMSAAVLYRREGTKMVLMAGAGQAVKIDPDWINGLSAGRAADREQLCLALWTIASAHGATISRRDDGRNPGWRGPEISLRIALNGVGALVDISDLHGGDHGLIHWHNDYSESRDTRNFAGAFKAAVSSFGSGSPHKATTSSDSWQGLAKALDAGLCLASRGEAFAPSAP
jgi:hypothetical protein